MLVSKKILLDNSGSNFPLYFLVWPLGSRIYKGQIIKPNLSGKQLINQNYFSLVSVQHAMHQSFVSILPHFASSFSCAVYFQRNKNKEHLLHHRKEMCGVVAGSVDLLIALEVMISIVYPI
jgi:hypothetical protein